MNENQNLTLRPWKLILKSFQNQGLSFQLRLSAYNWVVLWITFDRSFPGFTYLYLNKIIITKHLPFPVNVPNVLRLSRYPRATFSTIFTCKEWWKTYYCKLFIEINLVNLVNKLTNQIFSGLVSQPLNNSVNQSVSESYITSFIQLISQSVVSQSLSHPQNIITSPLFIQSLVENPRNTSCFISIWFSTSYFVR